MIGMRILMVGALMMLLSGCVTTQGKSNVDQLQIKVVDLEKKLEERDSEIIDLKYQVKDLSGRVGQPVIRMDDEPPVSSKSFSSSSYVDTGASEKILKVSASVSDVQKALKNAGFYKGSVDGKIGQQTKKAIESFQRQHNLTADGVVGRRTWEELKTYLQ